MFDDVYKDKIVLVTGDTGFKGSWLVIWLLNMGAKVIGVSLPPKTSRDNYVICGLEGKLTHIDQDIREYDGLLKIFTKYRPEIVFHLAAQAIVLEGHRSPLPTYSTNFMGTVNMLEAIRHVESVKTGIFITTDKCYENREWIYGYRENDRLGGEDPYSASKAACELAINSYTQSFFSAQNTANIASVRAGNVIGGGDWSEDRIFPDCIKALEKGEPIAIRNPNAIRSWQHVLEPLSGYLQVGSLLALNKKEFIGAWNFGPSSENMVTVIELAEEIVSQWGKGEIFCKDIKNKPVEAELLRLDISKAVNQLKWRPKLNFHETIKYAVEEYQIDNMTKEDAHRQRIKHIMNYMENR